ncbi:hypothetical protein [Carbonactinospora thermoautotrophica]|uniref:hypothetical protein n=1 Tax=Carbonactinospora thermoautotrophica TaxID=1469144 RepID=UPI002270E4F3|nr:hypothetical protein [Carbonactinospora thermoautotrophica]
MTRHASIPSRAAALPPSARPPRNRIHVVVALAVLAAGAATYLVAGERPRLAPADAETAGLVAGDDRTPWPPPGRFVLRTTLPEGPHQAAAYRLRGRDDARAAAERLARALGLDGLREEPGAWVASGGLRVSTAPGHPWTYRRAPRPCPPSTPPTPQPRDPADPVMPRDPAVDQAMPKSCAWQGKPVSPDDALRAARPVLAAVGLADASPSMRPGGGATTVAVDPKVGGLPTHGYGTTVTVTREGATIAVAFARGWLADAEENASYPVVDARTAFDRLNRRWELGPGLSCPLRSARPPQPGRPADPDQPVGHPANPAPSLPTTIQPDRPVPGTGEFQRSTPGKAPPRWCAWTYAIKRAEFGLALRWQDRQPLLVPAWLFSGLPENPVDHVPATQFPRTFAQVAVESADPAPAVSAPVGVPTPAEPDPGEPTVGHRVRVESAAVRGTEVRLTFFGGQERGLCRTEYAASVREDADRVVVAVTGTTNPPPNVRCVMLAIERHLTVRLARPLGERKLVDAGDDHEIARQPQQVRQWAAPGRARPTGRDR